MRTGVEVAEAPAQRRRPGERPLHRHLLVEQHPDQQGGAVAVEQPVGLGITGDVERPGHARHGTQRTGRGSYTPAMRLRSLGFAALAAAAVMQSCQPACTPPPPRRPRPRRRRRHRPRSRRSRHRPGQRARPRHVGLGRLRPGRQPGRHVGPDPRLLLRRHARSAHAGNQPIGVRLLALDNAAVDAASSRRPGAAIWNGVALRRAAGRCTAGDGTLRRLRLRPTPAARARRWRGRCSASRSGPITFTTDMDETARRARRRARAVPARTARSSTTAATSRRSSTARARPAPSTTLLVENYLKGVMSRELPSSWGYSGGGAGMNALWAFAVAQPLVRPRPEPLLVRQDVRHDACQVYGGAAYRASPARRRAGRGARSARRGNPTFECATTNRAVARDGRRRSGSGRTAASSRPSTRRARAVLGGRPFPAVDDSASNVPQQPELHVDAHRRRGRRRGPLRPRRPHRRATPSATRHRPGRRVGQPRRPAGHRRHRRHLQPRLPQRRSGSRPTASASSAAVQPLTAASRLTRCTG